MRRGKLILALAVAGAPALLSADSKWVQSRAGAVEFYSNAGAKPAVEKAGVLEQLRFTLGALTGQPDLTVDPPFRLIVLQSPSYPAALVAGRDRIAIPLAADRPIPASVLREATRYLLEHNVARLTPEIKQGLETFFSTLDVRGAHVIWGEPPPPAERTRDWARIELLATRPEYYGKFKVLLFNLQKGIADEPAYRNALGKSHKEFETELDAFWKAGVFAGADGPSRPLNPQRDFAVKPLDAADAQLALADLMNEGSRGEYERLLKDRKYHADACEGLALIALREHDDATALKYLTEAVDANTVNPRIWLGYAKLETDRPKSNDALDRAIELDPKLAEAHYLLGERKHLLEELKTATSLDPRQAAYWNALAEVYLDGNQFAEAGKAWRAAEQAASNPAEKERMHAAWAKVEGEKLDYQNSEKRIAAEAKQQETGRLKSQARAELMAAEARINQSLGATVAPETAVPWEEAQGVQLDGALKQVECLGKQTRVSIEGADHRVVKLLVAERKGLTCGPQNGRKVSVQYSPKKDARMGTDGETLNIP